MKLPIIALRDALACPAPPGALARSWFAHGTLAVEFYMPVGEDRQTPHSRDEIYVIARGSGWFSDGESSRPVSVGDFLFVPAGREHRFTDFTTDFATWVFFYGPEGGEKPLP
jgi:gentisate 1,2-dioxygenase